MDESIVALVGEVYLKAERRWSKRTLRSRQERHRYSEKLKQMIVCGMESDLKEVLITTKLFYIIRQIKKKRKKGKKSKLMFRLFIPYADVD